MVRCVSFCFLLYVLYSRQWKRSNLIVTYGLVSILPACEILLDIGVFWKYSPPPLGFGSCLTLFWDACELSKRMREKAGIWRRGEENLHRFNQIYKKKKKLDPRLCFKSMSPLCSICDLSAIRFENEPDTGGPILIPKMLGASDFSTVITLIIFQVTTKGFVMATMGWVEEWGVVADYKRKVLVIEKKYIFLNFFYLMWILSLWLHIFLVLHTQNIPLDYG